MKKYFIAAAVVGSLFTGILFAQGGITVPKVVKEAFAKRFPAAKGVTWEAENGAYEANWGGKSGEDNSVIYTPTGRFVEMAKAIAVNQLPATALGYLKNHYKQSSVHEAALVTDAGGKVSYEAEVAHKDVVFDQNGNFVKTENE